MSYSLSIHPDADVDAETIAGYIGERSFDGLLRWLDAYEAAQTRIVNNPFLCSPAHEEPILDRGLRQVLFKTPSGNHYRAVFIVDGSQYVAKAKNHSANKTCPVAKCSGAERGNKAPCCYHRGKRPL